MKYVSILSLLFLAIVTIKCAAPKEVAPPTAKQLSPSEISAYHKPIQMQIAWMPYKSLELKQTKKNNWVMVESDHPKESALPIIMVTYPATNDTVWVQMNTKNDLLGKLIKHSLMTQQPIKKPYKEYFEVAQCGSCHPSDVKVNFD